MIVALVWETVSGVVMIVGGVLFAAGLLVGHRWLEQFDRQDKVFRNAGIVFGIFVCLVGAYFVNLARQGYVIEHGRIVRYR